MVNKLNEANVAKAKSQTLAFLKSSFFAFLDGTISNAGIVGVERTGKFGVLVGVFFVYSGAEVDVGRIVIVG